MDEIFGDSYERCLRRDDFFDRFYDRYIASNEIVAQKFVDSDMERQKRMLKASLHTIMALRTVEPNEANIYFNRIGTLHNRSHHDIAPEYYDLWLTCLMEAVKDCDERYCLEIDSAWRAVLAGGIGVMKDMY